MPATATLNPFQTRLIRERQDALSTDVVSQIAGLGTALQSEDLPGCAELLLRLLIALRRLLHELFDELKMLEKRITVGHAGA